MTNLSSQALLGDDPAAARASSDSEIELLLERCARRDEAALESLYRLVSPRVLGLLLRILKRRPIAEEALQDVMVKIWQRADQYSAYRGRAMAWILAIARYRAIDLLRRHQPTATLDQAPLDSLADPDDFAEETTSDRLRTALSHCLDLLSEQQRKCIALAYVEGYSQDDIAHAIASPLGTVKSWMRRGLASLKHCLDS